RGVCDRFGDEFRKDTAMSSARCDRCRFFHPNPPAERPHLMSCCADQVFGGGYCHRRPPVWREGPMKLACFPLVECDCWCGEFEAKTPDDAPNRTRSHAHTHSQ